MIEELLSNAGTYIQTSPWLAVGVVFLGGLLTASNPCVLVMIPLMMSYVAGRPDEQKTVLRAFSYSCLFVVGLMIVFTALGMVAALAGTMYGGGGEFWNWVVVAVCVLMGLHLMELLKLPIPTPFNVQPKTRGALGAVLLGLLFGLVCTPCAAPILVVLLTYLAGSGASVAYGGLLLMVYALGHSVLILIAGTSMGAARMIIESKRMTRATDTMRRVAGALIVLIGLFFAYEALAPFSESETVSEKVEAAPAETRPQVSRIVFVGQKDACECTRKRIDTTWEALQSVLATGPAVPVERIQLDVDEKNTERYHAMRALIVAPGIYFLDNDGDLIELLQGEVREDQISEMLR